MLYIVGILILNKQCGFSCTRTPQDN